MHFATPSMRPPRASGTGVARQGAAATAVAAVREIQACRRHTSRRGCSGDDRDGRADGRAEGSARTLCAAGAVIGAPRLATANTAFDRFITTHAEITASSRRNTNVQSLALAFNKKGKITGACEENLRALRDSLAKRGFSATR